MILLFYRSVNNPSGTAMRVVLFKRFWTAEDTQEYPRALFIFGDNNLGYGVGGQAVIRRCPNALGIPTKKLPSLAENAFYTDVELADNKTHIMQAVERIKKALQSGKYDTLIFPKDGLGTGLAELSKRAPKTNEFLQEAIRDLQKFAREI